MHFLSKPAKRAKNRPQPISEGVRIWQVCIDIWKLLKLILTNEQFIDLTTEVLAPDCARVRMCLAAWGRAVLGSSQRGVL